MKSFYRTRLLATTLLGGAVTISAPALAQDTDTEARAEGGVLVVTGTRIQNPNLEQSAPVTFVDAQEIAFVQPTSAEEFIRDLPGTTPSIGSQTNNGSDGSARANLRGLGSNRNLVLMNGRRITPRGTDAVVDLNVIPTALLQRVDVFTGGASTAYGADAVAGVINFITRQDFTGIDVLAQYGITDRDDGEQYRVDVTLGADLDGGRGNAVLSVGYTKTDPVLQGNREIGRVARQSSICTNAQMNPPPGFPRCDPAIHNVTEGFPQGSSTAAPATILSPALGAVSQDGNSIVGGVANDYNFQPINLFQTPLERYNIYGQAHYEIAPAVEAYAEAMYVKTRVELNLAPAGIFGSTMQVPLNSPFLSAQQRQWLCEASVASPATGSLPTGTNCATAIANGSIIPVGIGRRFTEAGPRRDVNNTDMFHINIGLRGPLTSTLNWDVTGGYGESDRVSERVGWGLLSRARSAVLGCPAGSAAGCVPLNLFGPEGSITPEMIAFIDVPTYFFAKTNFTTVQAMVQGDLGWSLPWASDPIGVAAGVEYRKYFASSRGDAVSATPGEVLGAGAAGLPISGTYNTHEAFAEVNIPIVQDRPFFHSLTIEGGGRYADYSTSGGNWTWNAGGSWAPIRDIRFRGNYAKAVRAPNIAELFQPQVTALTARTTDPCQGTLAEIQARGANYQQLCLAQLALVGAPAGLLGTILAPTAGQIQSTQGGNPDLDPEKARTWTVGVVAQPGLLPGLVLTADYWDIKVTDAISAPSQSDVIDGCFNGTVPAFCGIIFRNPLTGQLSGPAETTFGPVLALSNLGKIHTSGFDFGVNYRHDLGFAVASLNSNIVLVEKNQFQATPLSINRECVGYYSVSCGAPQAEFQANTRLTFSFGDRFDASVRWRHLSATEVEPPAPNPQLPVGEPTTAGPAAGSIVEAYRRIPAYNYFDLALQYDVFEPLTLTLTVTNLFDKDPPAVGQTIGTSANNSGGTWPTVYDPLGRRYVVSARLRF